MQMPKCLRVQSIWYLTALDEATASPVRYSPISLAPLRVDSTEDYSDYDLAQETLEDHGHWGFTGLGLRFRRPFVAVAIQNCITSSGRVAKPIRDVIKEVGGWWERSRIHGDIQGFLWSATLFMQHAGAFDGFPVFVSPDAVCSASGLPLPGHKGNPTATNQEALSALLARIVLEPYICEGRRLGPPMASPTKRRRKRAADPNQLDLFDTVGEWR